MLECLQDMRFLILHLVTLFVLLVSPTFGFGSFCKHPPGKYCPFGSNRQFECPKGHYCPKDKFYKSCPTGTFLNVTGMSTLSDCLNCTAGYFCSRRGLPEPSGLCQKGYYCPVSSKTSVENICPVHHFCLSGSPSPIPCEIGKYQHQNGSWYCLPCSKVNVSMEILTMKQSSQYNSYNQTRPIATKISMLGENVTLQCTFKSSFFQYNNIGYKLSLVIKRASTKRIRNRFDQYNNSKLKTVLMFENETDLGSYMAYCIVNSSQCGVTIIESSFMVKVIVNDTFYLKTWHILVISVLSLIFVILLIFVLLKRLVVFHKDSTENVKTTKIESQHHTAIQLTDSPLNRKDAEQAKLITSGMTNINNAKEKISCSDDDVSPGDSSFDVFICYSSFDRNWVKSTLLVELEKNGIKACIDFRDFLVGAYIVENITEAIFNSNKTIAVLSPDFFTSVYCKAELKQALSRVEDHQVIPVMYRPCNIPQELQHMTYLDWCNPDVKPYFWELLVKAIK